MIEIPFKSESAIVPAAAVDDMRTMNRTWNSVPLIRCRDCTFSPDNGNHCMVWENELAYAVVRPEGFCAWAERGE